MNFGFENNKFYVDIPPCKRAPGTMRKESDLRALEIAEAGSKLMLCMSSGVDSQAVLHSFYEQGIPIECVFFYMPGYNDIEYAQLKEVENKWKIKVQIIDLDPMRLESDVLDTCCRLEVYPIQALQKEFIKLLPDNCDIVQMIHDPFVYVSPTNKFYYYQGRSSSEIARIRVHDSLNRKGRFVAYGDTSEFLYSILADSTFRAALYTSRYFDGNGLTKPGIRLTTVDRWDYYIKPIIYGKYWADELIYFPKYGGWENIPFMEEEFNWHRNHAIAIPYFEFLDYLKIEKTTKRFYENVPHK